MSDVIKNRYEFVALFDVENGNPNGDPDAGNMPRTDPETSLGIVTDVCLKRKIRNYVELAREGEAGYNILIKADKALNTKFTEAYEELGLKTGQKGKNANDVAAAQKYICDIVRGPVQLAFAKSVDPVYPQDITITRQAKTTEERQEVGSTEMGKKSIISYGLYRAEGYVSAMLAQKVTGFSEDDLELLWNAVLNMFEHDRSAARGKMTVRKLYIFKHDSALGNAPAGVLFDKIEVAKKADIAIPRQFSDYEITVDSTMPDGVTLIEKL